MGVGVEPPAPPAAAAAAAAGLSLRRLRPNSVSAKRNWPPGCGRFPAPPPAPAPAAEAGDAEKGVDGGAGILGGRTGEAIAPAAVSPPDQNGSLLQPQGSVKMEEAVAPVAISPPDQNGSLLQPQGSVKMEEAVAPVTVSLVAQNDALPRQQGADKVEEAAAPTAASHVAQNGTMPLQQGVNTMEVANIPAAISPVVQNSELRQQQGSNKVEEAAVLAAVQNGFPPHQVYNKVEEPAAPASASPATCNGSLSDALPQSGSEMALEDGEKGDNREEELLGNSGVLLSNGQEGSRAVEVAAPTVTVLESCGAVGASSSVRNGSEGTVLLVVEEQVGGGSSSEVGREEVAADGNGMEMGNRTGGGELERKENGLAGGRTKRWLNSAMNPPPKKRAVSAVRKFPPGCGRTAVISEGNEILDVSPVRTFPPGCGRAAAAPTDHVVLDVSPLRTFSPGCGRSVTSTGNGHEERLPSEATPVTNDDTLILGEAASPTLALEASNGKLESKRNEGHSQAHNRVQAPDDFQEKMKGKLSTCEGKHVARATVDDNMTNKLEGSLHRSTLRTPLSETTDAKTKGKRLESDKMNVALLGNAEASIGGKMQRKTLSSKKEMVRSDGKRKQNMFACKLESDDGIGKGNSHRSTKESKFGKHVATNQIQESDDMNLIPSQVIVQALMAPDKCPWTRGRKSVASGSKSRAPRNKLKGKDATPIKLLTEKIASRESIDNEIMEGNDDSNMEDDDNSRALVVYKENREICVTVPPSVPCGSHHKQLGHHDLDARSKVRKLLQLFQATCRKLIQVEEQGIRNVGRIDLEAIKALKKDPIYQKLGAIVGTIPGVEVGDEFHFRVELSIVGLHRPYQAGIDTSKVNGVPVAISIVASGCYPDELSSSHEMIYTGSGGKAGGNKDADDQKLERGNLALKNCIETKTPVRVIHGFKGQSKSEAGHSKGKQTSTFIYDGLYEVVECWQEGPKGEMVFKYKLQRIAGQPELALHTVKATRKSKVREGLCLPDISHGSERIPICVINAIDDMKPAPFKYITKVIYPTSYEKEPPEGCDCTNGCSDSIRCACVVKNGGEIPFNFNGAIVEARSLIYECGPSCRCPPTCHNRVSQHGIKIPLEIFKTGKTGWGVRSLSSISSGSFICEYVGELLEDKEAEKRQNDEYLFDIGKNYHDEELWEGLKSVVGIQSSTSSSKTMEGFTIDAAKCGNVGRFINHSCSPNLYAQHVLWDHGDMRMPHVMFFAVENIPPLQELTYHYNYKLGQVLDKNGEEKVKHCYCGASDCCGRLY